MKHLNALVASGQLTDPGTPRGRLLDCAARLFREKGYERTTVRDIGAAVGIQSGSIFHHFKSKEDILLALMVEALAYFTQCLEVSVQQADTSGDKVLACIRSEFSFTLGDNTVATMSVLVSEWRSLSVENQAEILLHRERYETIWLQAMQVAKEDGLLHGDVFVTRRLIAGAIHWSTNWFDTAGAMSLDDLALQTYQLVCPAKEA